MNRRIVLISLLIVISGITIFILGCPRPVVMVRPPEPRVEVYGVPPRPEAIWISGHWMHKRGEWVWVPGHWERRPRPNAVWVSGHWEPRGEGWGWIKGRWEYR